jgi:hypothetical protein
VNLAAQDEAATLPAAPPWVIAPTVDAILANRSTKWLLDVAANVREADRVAFFDHLLDAAISLEGRGEGDLAGEVLKIWEERPR